MQVLVYLTANAYLQRMTDKLTAKQDIDFKEI